MGFLRILFGLWFSWTLVRVARGYVVQHLMKKQDDQQIKPQNGSATLELLACPYCGVFTTAPCTNPDCPGKPV
jgi:hypothetical protein